MRTNVSTEDKLAILQAHIGPIMDELAVLADGNEVTGDDIVEVFAMGVAAVIDNDNDLTTPRHLRLAAETAAKIIEQRAKDFRRLSEMSGLTALDILRSGIPLGAPSRAD